MQGDHVRSILTIHMHSRRDGEKLSGSVHFLSGDQDDSRWY